MFYEDKQTQVRLTEDMEKKINRIVELYPDLYPNKSQFIRSAINHFLNYKDKCEVKHDGNTKIQLRNRGNNFRVREGVDNEVVL